MIRGAPVARIHDGVACRPSRRRGASNRVMNRRAARSSTPAAPERQSAVGRGESLSPTGTPCEILHNESAAECRRVPPRTAVCRHVRFILPSIKEGLAAVDDIDVTSSMSAPARPDEVVQPYMLTVVEAADLLGIGKTMAYELVHLFVESGGAYGIPAVRIRSRLAGAATGVDGED